MRKLSLMAMSIAAVLLPYSLFAQCGELVWSDEFDGTAVDESKWLIQTGNGDAYGLDPGWGNAELSFYERANVEVSDGTLKLKAYQDGRSGRIETKELHSWQYGRFEMSARLPQGTGLWPAFWMLGDNNDWPGTGEIDIMEYRGDQPTKWFGTVHYGTSNPYNHQHMGSERWLSDGSFTDGFHEFAVEWEAQEIRWYVDGELWSTITPDMTGFWPWDDQPFYLILNLAVGGPNTGFTGHNNPNFADGSAYEIDYVRVYSSATPQIAITGEDKLLVGEQTTVAADGGTDVSYSWSTTEGLEIAGASDQSSLEVLATEQGIQQAELTVTHGSNGQCPGQSFTYTHLIEVNANNCEFVWEDFDGQDNTVDGYMSGNLSVVNNPAPDNSNKSDGVGMYQRSTTQWDVMFLDEVFINNGELFVDGDYELKMDVYTTVPAGSTVQVELINSLNFIGGAAGGPGIHSAYTATTTTSGEWETLTFEFSEYKDVNGSTYVDDLDRISVLFDLASFSASTWYFDNFRQVHKSVADLSISGDGTVDTQAMGSYAITGAGNDVEYEWSVPQDAMITTGQGTASVTVKFGTTGGSVSCVVTPESGCAGKTMTYPVSVGGSSCATYSEEFDTGTAIDFITYEGAFSLSESNGVLTIDKTSGGDEWSNVDLAINDGINDITIDLEDQTTEPVVRLRAKASETMLMRLTLKDNTGFPAGNQWLEPLNSLTLTDQWQDFEIDFSGQFWNGSTWESWWPYGDDMDATNIDKVNLSFNPGYTSFPYDDGNQVFNTNFIGQVDIEYIRIGPECEPISTQDKTSIRNGLKVYPTISDGMVNIQHPQNGLLTIRDMQGRTVWTSNMVAGNHIVDATNWNPGPYLVSWNTDNGYSTKRIIITH